MREGLQPGQVLEHLLVCLLGGGHPRSRLQGKGFACRCRLEAQLLVPHLADPTLCLRVEARQELALRCLVGVPGACLRQELLLQQELERLVRLRQEYLQQRQAGRRALLLHLVHHLVQGLLSRLAHHLRRGRCQDLVRRWQLQGL